MKSPGLGFPPLPFAFLLLRLAFAALPLAAESPAPTMENTSLVAAYEVRGTELLPDRPAPATKADRELHARIWKALRTLVPAPLLAEIERFELFYSAEPRRDASETDGYAALADDDRGFILGLELDAATAAFIDRDPEARKEYLATLVHEFGHVLSLAPSQMAAEGEEGGLVLAEGRLAKDSYLNRFYERFWAAAYPGRGADTSSDEEGEALYDRAPSSFVSPYAATGPLEDFAESFASFVLDPKPRGSSIKARKVLFFYAGPELLSLREGFRRGIAALASN